MNKFLLLIILFAVSCSVNHEDVKITDENAFESYVALSHTIDDNDVLMSYKSIYKTIILLQNEGKKGKTELIKYFSKPYNKITIRDILRLAEKENEKPKVFKYDF